MADDGWLTVDSPIGAHDADRVRAAARVMAAEGLIELDPDLGEGITRARLATA